jgi:hypothetical protein
MMVELLKLAPTRRKLVLMELFWNWELLLPKENLEKEDREGAR